MKKTKLLLLLCLSLLCLLICSCDISDCNTAESDGVVYMTFEFNNGEESKTIIYSPLTGINAPTTPTRENYRFAGWYKDSDFQTPYDFESKPNQSLTLYAKWDFEYEKVINSLTEQYLPSVVKISATFYNSFFGQISSSKTYNGSGVVICEDSGRYYVLTNNHVVYNNTTLNNERYEVTDAYGTVYIASLVYRSALYDLALLSFEKETHTLPVVSLSDSDPEVSDIVISLGYPDGLINALTIGKTKSYTKVKLDETDPEASAVSFSVICHDAPIDHGSSGGPLFGADLHLVGINFAASTSNGEFAVAYSVPASRVREFLQNTPLADAFS